MNHTAQAPLTTAVFDEMSRDDRWLGFGYLGERRNVLNAHPDEVAEGCPAPEMVPAVDQRVIDTANARGWDYDGLFEWANSKSGRWLGDATFGGGGDLDADFARAIAQGLL
jgi:hypothetical protein